MSYKRVYLKSGKEESLKRFHPWIFSGAIARVEGEPEEGEVVMEIADALTEVMGDTVRNIYYKSETTLPFKADLLARENGFIKGGSADNVATENGLKFHVDWLKGQKTGFFVDQRENRHLLEHYARGRNVLNMFCYTGGFPRRPAPSGIRRRRFQVPRPDGRPI